ncbi:MAG: ABC transporter ATP-binding protein [Rhodospirillaceae bacterium]|nr:ABC transporter ATP-binding protein [Rhodospirillaceae bacterium]MCY4238298.1 ABC transporter ATP-binding protein [Rhodospirillaceae bacterium]
MSISVPDSPPLLTVKGLSAYYGESRALFGVGFSVEKGTVHSIVGANGAGKSTLLRAIVGMMNRGRAAHINGIVEFKGRRIDHLKTEEIVGLGVTMVPEGRRLFASMSVEENLLCGGFLARCRSAMDETLESVYDLFPRLADRRQQPVSQMSGGEQQMVSIGRALMSSPELILLDELSLGLAPIVVDQIYQRILTINQRGITCIVIEQDTERAMRVATSVSVLLEGRVVLEGDPDILGRDRVSAAYFGIDNAGISR